MKEIIKYVNLQSNINHDSFEEMNEKSVVIENVSNEN